MSRYKFSLLIMVLGLLSACSSPDIRQELDVVDWEIAGKIAARAEQEKSGSGLFRWQQANDAYVIRVFSPLGQPQLTLRGNQRRAELEQADGSRQSAASAAQLMQDAVGWSFPVKVLPYWFNGRLVGDEINVERNDEGISAFSTPQWQVKLSRYKDVAGQLLPHKIQLQRDDLTVTIIIKEHAIIPL